MCCSAHIHTHTHTNRSTQDGSAPDSVNTTTGPLNPDSNSPNDRHLTSLQRAQLQRLSRNILVMILWRWEIPFMMLHISIGDLRLRSGKEGALVLAFLVALSSVLNVQLSGIVF